MGFERGVGGVDAVLDFGVGVQGVTGRVEDVTPQRGVAGDRVQCGADPWLDFGVFQGLGGHGGSAQTLYALFQFGDRGIDGKAQIGAGRVQPAVEDLGDGVGGAVRLPQSGNGLAQHAHQARLHAEALGDHVAERLGESGLDVGAGGQPKWDLPRRLAGPGAGDQQSKADQKAIVGLRIQFVRGERDAHLARRLADRGRQPRVDVGDRLFPAPRVGSGPGGQRATGLVDRGRPAQAQVDLALRRGHRRRDLGDEALHTLVQRGAQGLDRDFECVRQVRQAVASRGLGGDFPDGRGRC